MSTPAQPWIATPAYDLVWILSPPFIASAIAVFVELSYPGAFNQLPLWAWVVLVMSIDVAHVWSTLFRTYLNSEARERYQTHLWCIPLAAWIAGVMLYSLGSLLFWSALAYLAVFHFIRQQYGFMRIYARREKSIPRWSHRLDSAAIYLATLYPIVYWHTHLPREFSWFIEGDFMPGLSAHVGAYSWALYLFILVCYCAKETYFVVRDRYFNLPKNLLLLGTLVAWYLGIVHYNADLPFTLTNVVSHGIPYIALVWFFQQRTAAPNLHRAAWRKGAKFVLFVISLLILAYLEESLWDGLVWREHLHFFSWAAQLPALQDRQILAFVVPLLAVPQTTHYILDAFIWRLRSSDEQIQQSLATPDNAPQTSEREAASVRP